MKKLSIMLLALFVIPAIAQQPQSGQSRGNRTPDEYIKLLESERRVSELQVNRVIDALKIKPGQRIADLGAGSGLFTRPIAGKLAGKGIVYAIDIDPELLKYIEKTAQEQKLSNIRTVLGSETDPKLPEPVDLIVIIDTLHHIQNQPNYLKNLKRYLRPDGRIAIIDFTNDWPAGHEKMKYTLDDLEGWMKAAGYKRTEKFDFLNNDFFVVYK
ncbi:MAG TPA: class I SAM-dependent methyltransferase [Blastocatellia bacterium]|nr:class I SAM-dependent methyltransferase [Blastocatellia bacterium]